MQFWRERRKENAIFLIVRCIRKYVFIVSTVLYMQFWFEYKNIIKLRGPQFYALYNCPLKPFDSRTITPHKLITDKNRCPISLKITLFLRRIGVVGSGLGLSVGVKYRPRFGADINFREVLTPLTPERNLYLLNRAVLWGVRISKCHQRSGPRSTAAEPPATGGRVSVEKLIFPCPLR